jgi:glucose-6-phosphate 1-dehydrogenase
MSEDFGVQGRGGFYDQTGTIRDVVQNHLFQVFVESGHEPPVRSDSESIRDEKVKYCERLHPSRKGLGRGQFCGYCRRKTASRDSQTETFCRGQVGNQFPGAEGCRSTFAPASVADDLPRSSLFRKPPSLIPESVLVGNHLRLRLGPEITIAME